MRCAGRQSCARSAFTLIELVVVVIVLSVIAGVIVPRMVSRTRSDLGREVDAIKTLLSAAAQRDVLTSQPIALHFSAETNLLRVLTLSDEEEPSRRDDDLWPWREDLLIPAVHIEHLQLDRITSDELLLDEKEWLLELVRGVRRPNLLLEFRDTLDKSWFVSLPSRASVAMTWTGEIDDVEALAIDLDEEGQGDREW